MTGLLGKKIGMTSFVNDEGKVVPCTLLEVGPCVVTQVKTQATDGYEAVQIAYDPVREKNVTKPLLGHFRKAGVEPHRIVREIKGLGKEVSPGDVLTVADIFEEGEFVDVVGTSKGKGFAGVVKRHGFAGVGGRTHGQHNRERAPGSLGASSFPSRVLKGKRMAGRMGNRRVKAINLQVVKILPDKHIMVVKGAVPGPRNGYVMVLK